MITIVRSAGVSGLKACVASLTGSTLGRKTTSGSVWPGSRGIAAGSARAVPVAQLAVMLQRTSAFAACSDRPDQVHNCGAMPPTLHIPHQGGCAASEVVSRRLLLGLGRRAQLAVWVRVLSRVQPMRPLASEELEPPNSHVQFDLRPGDARLQGQQPNRWWMNAVRPGRKPNRQQRNVAAGTPRSARWAACRILPPVAGATHSRHCPRFLLAEFPGLAPLATPCFSDGENLKNCTTLCGFLEERRASAPQSLLAARPPRHARGPAITSAIAAAAATEICEHGWR